MRIILCCWKCKKLNMEWKTCLLTWKRFSECIILRKYGSYWISFHYLLKIFVENHFLHFSKSRSYGVNNQMEHILNSFCFQKWHPKQKVFSFLPLPLFFFLKTTTIFKKVICLCLGPRILAWRMMFPPCGKQDRMDVKIQGLGFFLLIFSVCLHFIDLELSLHLLGKKRIKE